MNWHQLSWKRWVRKDGAVVKWDDTSPHPNPASTLHPAKMWTAWEPDPSESYLGMRRCAKSRFTFPRRWKSAESAMKAVDREFPLANVAHPEQPQEEKPGCIIGDANGDYSQRDAEVAASVIQWLGSPVGKAFVEDILNSKKPRQFTHTEGYDR